MAKPTYEEAALYTRAPSIPGELDKLYSTHFDIATAGGKIIPGAGRSAIFKSYLQKIVVQHRKSPTMLRTLPTAQFASQAAGYWVGRTIDGPTGLTIVLSPGIWVPLEYIPNFVPQAKKWIDKLVIAFYLQKLSLLGITISKAVPGIVSPWSGAFFQGLDVPGGAPAVTGPMSDNYDVFVDLLMAATKGKPEIGDKLKSAFDQSLNTVFNPAVFEAAKRIPNVYGVDFNTSNKITDVTKSALSKLQ